MKNFLSTSAGITAGFVVVAITHAIGCETVLPGALLSCAWVTMETHKILNDQ